MHLAETREQAYRDVEHGRLDPTARLRSYDLFARHVAPRSRASTSPPPTPRRAPAPRAPRSALADNNLKAVAHSTAKYQAELDAKTKP